ncbi:MAG: hypothetical protein LBS96_01650 [Oscillospiraceae bacterium]|jgi:hypothetical protein|nr:hypothetical protein [Oscillospiraceae bacterium]
MKPRKMLGDWRGESIQRLMQLIETQSKETLVRWTTGYARQQLLPIYEKHCPDDARPRAALDAAQDWLGGNIPVARVKPLFKGCFAAAQAAEKNPDAAAHYIAQAAARAIYAAVNTAAFPTMSINIAYYGATAIAYDRVGWEEAAEIYDAIAEAVFAEEIAALQAIAVEEEPNPAKIKWDS